MIASQLYACLSNLNLLPACSLSQAESLVNDRPSLPKTTATSRVQQVFPAEGSREASLGIKPTSVRPARATQSAAPSNTPLSRHEMKGSPLSDSSGLPSSRDSAVVLSEVERPLAQLRPKGEGPTVCGLPTGRGAFPTTWSKGEGVWKSPCPSPSSTKCMRAELVTQGQPCASFHHHHADSHDGREKCRRWWERERWGAVSLPISPATWPCAAPTPGREKHGLARRSSPTSRGWRTASPATFLPIFSSKEGSVPHSPSPLFPPTQEPRPTSRERCQVEKEEEGVEVLSEDDAGSPDSSPNFMEMMEFMCTRFLEARAPSAQALAPLFPGLQKEVRPSTPQLKRAQAVDFMMQRASSDLACANESTKPSFLKYLATKYYRAYKIGDDEGRSKAAKINPDLSHLLVGQGEPRVSFSQGETTKLEQALLSIQGTQSFLFWLLGIQVSPCRIIFDRAFKGQC